MPNNDTLQKAVTVGQLNMLKDYGDSTYATKTETSANFASAQTCKDIIDELT